MLQNSFPVVCGALSEPKQLIAHVPSFVAICKLHGIAGLPAAVRGQVVKWP